MSTTETLLRRAQRTLDRAARSGDMEQIMQAGSLVQELTFVVESHPLTRRSRTAATQRRAVAYQQALLPERGQDPSPMLLPW